MRGDTATLRALHEDLVREVSPEATAATGRGVESYEAHIFRLRDGMVTEFWEVPAPMSTASMK